MPRHRKAREQAEVKLFIQCAQSIDLANKAQQHSLAWLYDSGRASDTDCRLDVATWATSVFKPSSAAPHPDTRSLSHYASSQHLAMSPPPLTPMRSPSPTKENHKTQDVVKACCEHRHQGGAAHASTKRPPTLFEPPSSPMTFLGGGGAAAQEGGCSAEVSDGAGITASCDGAAGGMKLMTASASHGRYRVNTPIAITHVLLPSAIARSLKSWCPFALPCLCSKYHHSCHMRSYCNN